VNAAPQAKQSEPPKKKKWEKKDRGQNKKREFGSWGDALPLCNSRALSPEFSPEECRFGDKCKLCHDIRKYLESGKRDDLDTFGGICPVWDAKGYCNAGWKCRFVGSHSTERETEDGRKELVLLEDSERMAKVGLTAENKKAENGVYNIISMQEKINLSRRRIDTSKADEYTKWLNETWGVEAAKRHTKQKTDDDEDTEAAEDGPEFAKTKDIESAVGDPASAKADSIEIGGELPLTKHGKDEKVQETRAGFTDPPFRPSEKRRLYYGPETPVLAPLTTQGNLPFRRLCVDMGAQITYSEMAMSLPLIQGEKGEWALMRAHESEMVSPRVFDNSPIINGYDNRKDTKFGAQISSNKPWVAFKATSILARYTPQLRSIDLNCGCPIDLVFKTGAGSALLDTPAKLEKILRGMNTLSDEIPITTKIRMGSRDSAPNADALARRLIFGGHDSVEAGLGPCGIAALTLHGRSRQQRYTRSANWEYIASISTMIKDIKKKQDEDADTIRESDARNMANGADGKVYFIGNGDCYSHIDYTTQIANSGVDSVMIARGALVKPWIFEEIEQNQYLDKSSSQRLEYIEKFCKYGMEVWGSDEMGVGTTRRFLLEWLSFACRYIPLGILERLPPKLNDRPPLYKGRDDLETLLGSPDYRDWIKITYDFLFSLG
jgi:tRNA-dihydrouridine synthase 3